MAGCQHPIFSSYVIFFKSFLFSPSFQAKPLFFAIFGSWLVQNAVVKGYQNNFDGNIVNH